VYVRGEEALRVQAWKAGAPAYLDIPGLDDIRLDYEQDEEPAEHEPVGEEAQQEEGGIARHGTGSSHK